MSSLFFPVPGGFEPEQNSQHCGQQQCGPHQKQGPWQPAGDYVNYGHIVEYRITKIQVRCIYQIVNEL
ncbi:hypothetical protein [Methanosarcina horonobensis]|uniref:hypothetical protein n=1 Tax=Methanosarcina horonobensis TaxID=418008 RepID=UPI0022B8BA01|nr:hypothetical protein [Methanosarcina horonobensis]